MKNPVGGYAIPADYVAFFNDTRGTNEAPDKSNLNKPKRFVGQLVFMVIDALRADFVFSIKNIKCCLVESNLALTSLFVVRQDKLNYSKVNKNTRNVNIPVPPCPLIAFSLLNL